MLTCKTAMLCQVSLGTSVSYFHHMVLALVSGSAATLHAHTHAINVQDCNAFLHLYGTSHVGSIDVQVFKWRSFMSLDSLADRLNSSFTRCIGLWMHISRNRVIRSSVFKMGALIEDPR